MNYYKWLFLLCYLLSHVAKAQKKDYQFSLKEAIEFALDSSYTSQKATRDVAKALKQKWQATAIGLPQIDGEIVYSNQLKQPVSLVPATFGGGPPGQFVPAIFSQKQQASATATLSQLIFDGSYLVGLEAASTFAEYTYTQKEKQDLTIIEGITNAYGAVLLTQESIAILKKNISNLEKNLDEVLKTFENGLTEEENVEQLQITLLQIKNQLNNNERLEDISLKMLKLALGISIKSNLLLTDNLETISVQKTNTTAVFEKFDLSRNNDYKLSELLINQRRLEHKLERAKTLPTLGAFVNYGTTAFSNTFTFLDTDQRWYASSILGVSLNVPIFSSGLSGARKKIAKLNWEQAQISHNENKQRIRLAYEQAKSDFEFAIDNLSALKQNLNLAERIERKNQIKFGEGLSSSFDLRQAQTQLYSAQQEYLLAQLKVIQNNAKLQSILNIHNK